jgi:hypothetical protein
VLFDNFYWFQFINDSANPKNVSFGGNIGTTIQQKKEDVRKNVSSD